MGAGRKPADVLAAKKGKGAGHQAIWTAIRAQSDGFTRRSLREAVGDLSERLIRTYVTNLEAAGIIAWTGKMTLCQGTSRPSRIYHLSPGCDHGTEAPRVRKDGSAVLRGLAREQMWRTMRILKVFTLKDLVIAASTEEVQINSIDAKFYCRMLAQAGYLSAQKGENRHSRVVYTFIPVKNTGPASPQIHRMTRVFDANLGKVVWTGEGDQL